MWARGQAWAILGFAAAYRETGDDVFLQAARRVTDRYLADLPADMVPYWDFRDPAIPAAPRDSSAAAIAASGMIDLARSEPDAANGARYAAAARATLASLMSPAYVSLRRQPGASCSTAPTRGTPGPPTGARLRGRLLPGGAAAAAAPPAGGAERSAWRERAPAPATPRGPSTGVSAPPGRRAARSGSSSTWASPAASGALRLALSPRRRPRRPPARGHVHRSPALARAPSPR